MRRILRINGAPARGIGMIELIIAVLLVIFLTVAAGTIYLASNEAWRGGQIKLTLQQEVTRAQEQIGRDVRASRTLDSPASDELFCYDETGATLAHYELDAATDRLLRNGTALVDYDCIGVTFTTGLTNYTVQLLLEFEDVNENVVRIESTAMMRNLDLESYPTGGF